MIAGPELARLRKIIDGECQFCDKPITGITTKKYCSGRACSNRAYRLRIKRRLINRNIDDGE